MRQFVCGLVVLNFCALSIAAQEPPPSPDDWEGQVAVFRALPQRLPTKNIAPLEKLVADDLQVYRDGKLVHRTRRAWIDELQSYRQVEPGDPQGFSVSRDEYHKLADGGVSVREFTYPIAPDGAQIVYHPSNPLRYVTYYFKTGKVERIVYGPPMTSYAGLCQAVNNAKPSSNGEPRAPVLCT